MTFDIYSTGAGSASFWEQLYRTRQSHWDLNGPTPVFQRLAAGGKLRPGKMLVLGAGHGHDARLFARHGFEVTAVDFAEVAAGSMKRLDDPSHPIVIVQADFFTLPQSWNGRFDYVLDYTSFCAIVPARRNDYAGLVARVLKGGAISIMLAYPIGTRSGGPPFAVQPDDIIALFSTYGLELWHRELPFDSTSGRKGYEELLLFEKEDAKVDE